MFTYGMPAKSLMRLSDASQSQVYVTAWIDGHRGKSAHVSFDTGSGLFQFSLPFRRGDPDLLKLQFCIRMRDQSTNNKRSMELYTTCARMDVMLQGKTDRFRTRNQFSPSNYGDVELSIVHEADLTSLQLRPSKLNLMSRANDMADSLSKRVVQTLMKNDGKAPPGGTPYLEGITSRPWSGRYNIDTDEEEYPPFKTHHAQMGPQQESIRRLLPIPVVVYHQYLKIVHSSKTIQGVLALPDDQFAQFFLEGLQFTCDAGLFPYERDFFPELGISLTDGLSVAASDTEDLVSGLFVWPFSSKSNPSFCLQGWPATESPFCGRHLRTMRPIKVSKSMSMDELGQLFEQDPVDPSAFRMLIPDVEFGATARAADVLALSVSQQSQDRVLQDMYLQICTDDCETSALFAILMKQTSLHLYERLNEAAASGHAHVSHRSKQLKALCSKWNIFKNFSPTSWDLMVKYLDRGNNMLKTKQIRTMTAVGLATTASAAQSTDGRPVSYGGHCFNVCTIQTPSMPDMKVGLLEGTAPLFMVRVTKDSPTVSVQTTDGGPPTVMNMPKFLTCLSTTLLCMTQVINSPNGMEGSGAGGWPLPVKVNGWLNHTTVMCSLDSDPSTELRFYNRVMFVGWPCTDRGQGCMPVEERVDGKVLAGCHPFGLVNSDIRGVDASFQEDTFSDVREIMDEVTPPMVRESVVRELASMWIPCRALETVNTEAKREDGVEYFRVSAMESPCAPEYLSIIFEAKRRVAEETNRINEAKANSDGIRLYALLEGLSAVLCADVPNRTIPTLTLVDSLKTAMANLKYPSSNRGKG
jgi:hypothetical protein